MSDPVQRGACAAYAKLLSYPGPGLADALGAARALVGQDGPAAAALGRFAAHVAGRRLERLQEEYTAAFDLQPTSAPYVGHQLLGDSPLRGPLLAQLSQLYAREGFAPDGELPDHVAEVLRFLATSRDGAERDDLLRDGLIPALEKMAAALGEAADPYADVVTAARDALGPAAGASAAERPGAGPPSAEPMGAASRWQGVAR